MERSRRSRFGHGRFGCPANAALANAAALQPRPAARPFISWPPSRNGPLAIPRRFIDNRSSSNRRTGGKSGARKAAFARSEIRPANLYDGHRRSCGRKRRRGRAQTGAGSRRARRAAGCGAPSAKEGPFRAGDSGSHRRVRAYRGPVRRSLAGGYGPGRRIDPGCPDGCGRSAGKRGASRSNTPYDRGALRSGRSPRMASEKRATLPRAPRLQRHAGRGRGAAGAGEGAGVYALQALPSARITQRRQIP